MFGQLSTERFDEASDPGLVCSQRLLGKAVVPYPASDSVIFPVSRGRQRCAMTTVVEGIGIVERAFGQSSSLRAVKIFYRGRVGEGELIWTEPDNVTVLCR
jgi:hypothetical protein